MHDEPPTLRARLAHLARSLQARAATEYDLAKAAGGSIDGRAQHAGQAAMLALAASQILSILAEVPHADE